MTVVRDLTKASIHGEWIVDKEATIDSVGQKHRKCSTCYYYDYATVSQHSMASEWSSNKTHHWHACMTDDCQEKVSYTEHTFCDWVIDKEASVDTGAGLKHRICSVCDYYDSAIIPIPTSEGLEFELNADGKSCSLKGM